MESLSEEIDFGIGGTLMKGIFPYNRSREDLLRMDTIDGVLDNVGVLDIVGVPLEVSTSVTSQTKSGVLGATGGACLGLRASSRYCVSSSSRFEEREEGLEATGAGIAIVSVVCGFKTCVCNRLRFFSCLEVSFRGGD